MPGLIQVGKTILNHVCPNAKRPAGTASQTESRVFAEGVPVAVVGDQCEACKAPVVIASCTNVCVGGKPVVTLNDQTTSGEKFIMGSKTVLIGE